MIEYKKAEKVEQTAAHEKEKAAFEDSRAEHEKQKAEIEANVEAKKLDTKLALRQLDLQIVQARKRKQNDDTDKTVDDNQRLIDEASKGWNNMACISVCVWDCRPSSDKEKPTTPREVFELVHAKADDLLETHLKHRTRIIKGVAPPTVTAVYCGQESSSHVGESCLQVGATDVGDCKAVLVDG